MNNIVSAKVKFCRNIKGFPFCSKLGSQQNSLLDLALKTCNQLNLSTTNLNDVGDDVIDNLKAKRMLDKDYVVTNCSGFATNSTNDGFVQVGYIDHIRVGGLGENIYSAYDNAKNLDKQLCNKLSFMYTDKYGFLTPKLANLGSGIRVSVYVMLPAIERLNFTQIFKKACDKMAFEVANLSNGLYQISTVGNLGFTEKQVLENTENYLKKIINLEMEASKQLAKNEDEILDKCARAKAILKNCILLSNDELCKLCGDISVAINSGLETEFDCSIICEIIKNISAINNTNKNKKQLAKNIKKHFK